MLYQACCYNWNFDQLCVFWKHIAKIPICLLKPLLGTVYWHNTEKAMAPHSSTLAWKIPWMEEPGGPQSMGSLRVGHDWATSFSLFTSLHWRRKWQPTPVFLPGESQGRGIPRPWEAWWLPSMGSQRVRHNWSDLAAAVAATDITRNLEAIKTGPY